MGRSDAATHARLEAANALLAAIRKDASPEVATEIDSAMESISRGLRLVTHIPMAAGGEHDGPPGEPEVVRRRRHLGLIIGGGVAALVAWTGRNWRVAAGSVALGTAAAVGTYALLPDTPRQAPGAVPPVVRPTVPPPPDSREPGPVSTPTDAERRPPIPGPSKREIVFPPERTVALPDEEPTTKPPGIPSVSPTLTSTPPGGRERRRRCVVRIPPELGDLGVIEVRVAVCVPSYY